MMMNASQSLAEEINSGRLPVQEALRIAMLIAGRLRDSHEHGQNHGALSPATVVLDGNDVRLLPAPDIAAVTPYTAPELLQGSSADARSDIFSFGAILYEMLTGRPAFEGGTPEALAEALKSATPRPSGNPIADRLVNGCLAKSPDDRFQRVQKLMADLRVMASTARRTTPIPVVNNAVQIPGPIPVPKPVADRHMVHLGVRLAARTLQQESSVSRLHRMADKALESLRQQHAFAAEQPRIAS
jgi:serine/threonine protein kinase